MSHSLVLHRSFTGLLVDFDNDHPTRGEKMKRSREINYPNLRFHVILDMRDTSLAGRTHSYVLVKMEGIA